ncbi:hypothetical protein ISN75_13765 [Dyella marensis]|uniref:hypothetical protein n=1 Tax=Dyella marensis TaxID=500610 RepID=UPI0031DD96F8
MTFPDDEAVYISLRKGTYERLQAVITDFGVDSVIEFLEAIADGSFGVYDMSESSNENLAREQEFQEEAINYDQEVKKLCILHFFKEPRYVVDMSRYREMIDMVSGLDTNVREGLDKYLNESKILSDIYLKVRNHFQLGAFAACLHGERIESRDSLPRLPSVADIDGRFQIEMGDVYRRADHTVAKRIEQGT